MNHGIEEFRSGIFALRTRRFGTVAELMIETLYELSAAQNQFHDRFDDSAGQRVEVKFSTVMKACENPITIDNVVEECLKANLSNRVLKSSEINDFKFDCNIQQIKPSEFDILYYGLFFSDQIAIFKINSSEISSCPGYSDKQHKGNIGEGQFHLNMKTLPFHMENYFVQWLSYEELHQRFSSASSKK